MRSRMRFLPLLLLPLLSRPRPGPTAAAAAAAAATCACPIGEIRVPVTLDGRAGAAVVAPLRAAQGRRGRTGSNALDAFHVAERVQEFCFAARINHADCGTLLASVTASARQQWERLLDAAGCSPDSDFCRREPVRSRLFPWQGTGERARHGPPAHRLFVQVEAPVRKVGLPGLSITFDADLNKNVFGHSLGDHRFVGTQAGASWLIDEILVPAVSGPVDDVDVVLVPPTSTGAQPWTVEVGDADVPTTVVVVVDGGDSTESPHAYLERMERLLTTVRAHNQGAQRHYDLGCVVLGDRYGVFPTSMLGVNGVFDWTARQFYFQGFVGVPWIPLGPMTVPAAPWVENDKDDDTGDGGDGGGGVESMRPVLLLVVFFEEPPQLICEHMSAEESSNATGAERCYGDWRNAGIQEAVDILRRQSSASLIRVERMPRNLDPSAHAGLQAMLRNATFVACPAESLGIGSESRLMWSVLEAGAVPIIAGPAHKLGLAPLGARHPLPQVRSHGWRRGLVSLLSPVLRNLADGGEASGAVSLDAAVAHGSLARLRKRVGAWWRTFRVATSARLAHAVREGRQRWRRRSSLSSAAAGGHAFLSLLSSYRAWVDHHQQRPRHHDLLEESYRSAWRAVRNGLDPPPLRVFAFELMAGVEQALAEARRKQRAHGWQSPNRRSLVCVSEALRIVLGEYGAERGLFPWLPKLLLAAGALSWDQTALRAAESLTRTALAFNPLSAPSLEQLASIYDQIRWRKDAAAEATSEAAAQATTTDLESVSRTDQQVAPVPFNADVEVVVVDDPVESIRRFAGMVRDGQGDRDAAGRRKWAVAEGTVVARWWRSADLPFRVWNHRASGGSEDGEARGDGDDSGGEVVAAVNSGPRSLLPQDRPGMIWGFGGTGGGGGGAAGPDATAVPLAPGEPDSVDEISFLLGGGGADVGPLLVLLESRPP